MRVVCEAIVVGLAHARRMRVACASRNLEHSDHLHYKSECVVRYEYVYLTKEIMSTLLSEGDSVRVGAIGIKCSGLCICANGLVWI